MSTTKLLNGHPFIQYSRAFVDPDEMIAKSKHFFNKMDERRSCREFSSKPVSEDVIRHIIKTASTAPSGAHKQPWTFCVIADKALKKQVRIAAEKEEEQSYRNRMSEEWLNDLAPLGTNPQKPFLELAPYLVVMFRKIYDTGKDGSRRQNYYVQESCGIACGLLIAAIHHAGLVALTHTPSPMNFLTQLLNRPENEKPFLLIPVGYPAEECWVPDIKRKALDEILVWY